MNFIKNNKTILIAAFCLLLIIGTGVAVFSSRQDDASEEPEPQTKQRITDPINEIPIADRPYLRLIPQPDGHHIDISIEHLNLAADLVDYEFEYQSGSMLQMVMGQVELAAVPTSEQVFLGSCSAGGACTYHENVTGGSLLLKFSNTEDNYTLKSDWRYFDNQQQTKIVSSRDAKFQIQGEAIDQQRYVIVYNSPGLPTGLDQEVIAEHYAVAASGPLSGSEQAQVTIRCNELVDKPIIVGYDGQEWQQFETNIIQDRQVEAEAEYMQLYTVINQES